MSYGVPADIWSAGATLYQTLTGHVVTDNPDELLKKGWRPPTHPRFTHQLQDLLNRMLSAKPTTRPQSATSVMRHPWFAGFDWAALREGRMKAPYVPADHRCRPHRGSAASGETVANVSPSAAAVTSPLPTPAAATAPSSVPQARGSHHPLGGGQRLATVIEGVSTQPNALAEGGKVMQRSALSGRGEGSIKRGREGLVRDGASFETALGTVTTAEVRAVAEGAAAAAAAAAAIAATSSVASDVARMSSGGGGLGDASGSGSGGLPLDPNNQTQGGQRHGAAQPHAHGHGLSVRFALGVAECA
ncbi:hypothetical protein Vretifemale_686 [Volvox reticuliferus]|nr:hypothetical protein Vretifemale_686 [Volvox reticuliferus]